MTRWLFVVGSPRPRGNSAKFARMAEMLILDAFPEDTIDTLSLSDMSIEGCNGCDYCEQSFECIIDDDMNSVLDGFDRAECLCIFSPIYFAGVPSQFKALLDRLQPFFWERQALKKAGNPLPPKKPAMLLLTGGGGDPYGHEPAVASISAALALANIRIESTITSIGERPSFPQDAVAAALHQLKQLAEQEQDND